VLKRCAQLALLGWLSIALPAVAQLSESEMAAEGDYQSKLKELQKNIQNLQKELDAVKGNRAELLQQLKSNETEIGDLLKKIDDIKQDLKSEEQALLDLNREREHLLGEQNSEKKHIAQQVRAAYQLGGQSNLKLLLNQNDPEVVSRLLKYHDYFLAAHTAKISTYLENIERLDAIEPQIVRNTESLERKRSQLQTRYDQLRDKQRARENTLARLDATINSKDEELQKLARDREHIEKLMQQIVETVGNRSSFNSNAPFAELRGKLPWPTQGKIAHRFGTDRVAGKMKWDGVVIRASEGSPVKAIHQGRVVFADYLRGHGLLIILDHGNGYMSLYAHNQSLKKNVGNWVEPGEVIASVGNTGGQQEAGLYFEIRQNGQPTNPSGWCG
jgi:septal ring factor EnvC (AmiA/AmiB activator)